MKNKNTFLKSCCAVIALTMCIPAFLPSSTSAAKVKISKDEKTQRLAKLREVFDQRAVAYGLDIDPAKGTADLGPVERFTVETDRPTRSVSRADLKEAVDNVALLRKAGKPEDVLVLVRHEDQKVPVVLAGNTLTLEDDHTVRLHGLKAKDQERLQEVQEYLRAKPDHPIFISTMYLPTAKPGQDYYWFANGATISKHPTKLGFYRVHFDLAAGDPVYAIQTGGILAPMMPGDIARMWDIGSDSFKVSPPNVMFSYRDEAGELGCVKGVLSNPDRTGTEFDLGPLLDGSAGIALKDDGTFRINDGFATLVDEMGGGVW